MALDPGFAQAWAQISEADSILYGNSTPTPALAERARQAAEKAVALAPDRPEGYLALGNYVRLVVADFSRALGAVREGAAHRARQRGLSQGNRVAEQSLGRWDAAVEHFRQAERLDPRSVSNCGRSATRSCVCGDIPRRAKPSTGASPSRPPTSPDRARRP